MKMHSLEDLFEHELQDLRSAEQQLIEALPQMVQAASSEPLKNAFKEHLQQTRTHLKRIDKAFEKLGKEPKEETCKGMKGLIREGEDVIKNAAEPAVMDAGLIAAAQRVEHYEISAYGTARAHARTLGYDEVADILQTTLDEEGEANKLLTQLAEGRMSFSGVNERAIA